VPAPLLPPPHRRTLLPASEAGDAFGIILILKPEPPGLPHDCDTAANPHSASPYAHPKYLPRRSSSPERSTSRRRCLTGTAAEQEQQDGGRSSAEGFGNTREAAPHHGTGPLHWNFGFRTQTTTNRPGTAFSCISLRHGSTRGMA